MSTNPSDPNQESGGGLWGRLFGVEEEGATNAPEAATGSGEGTAQPAAPPPPVQAAPPEAPPEAPVSAPPAPVSESSVANQSAEQAPATETAAPEAAAATEPPAAPAIENCPACGAELAAEAEFCGDCGFSLPADGEAVAGTSATGYTPPQSPVKDRYQIGKLISQRLGIYRYEGQDLKNETGQPQPVTIVVGAKAEEPAMAAVEEESNEDAGDSSEELLPTFDEPMAVAEEISSEGAAFPSVGWEKNILTTANNPALPTVADHFVEGDFEYLVEWTPNGTVIWDAWWEGETGTRYGWLIQIAEGLHALHEAGALLEGVRPDIISISEDGQAYFTDITDLLPLPFSADVPIRGSLYTAPELMVNPDKVTAKADLYSFGASLYSLEYLGHNLEEKDFEKPYSPILITERYPDVHPAFNRLIIKTFVRDIHARFPTGDAEKIDASGFTELIDTLKICKRNFERVRLDIAAWTTTGMIRTNNEDAFAFLHACESRMDDVYDYALVILCDGMGGYEAGEIAAAMTIEEVREYLLQQPMFASLAGKKRQDGVEFDEDKCKEILKESLRHANNVIHTEARKPGSTRRGMGCTADVVYVDDVRIVVGHVGDSRVYHVSNNTINQLTRDQTLVNRLVELGMLTPEEAEDHDRKNELQQAIGGQPDVEPGLYSAPIKRGDWILVCSDGLTGHIKDNELEEMLTRETSGTAEDACRRLLNLVNLRVATDNSTIVLIRTS